MQFAIDNFNFTRKNVEIFWDEKTRENVAVLHFAIDNFDFTRKIVMSKSKVLSKLNVKYIDVDDLPFSFAVPRFSFDFQPLFVQPQLFFLCPLPRNLY